MWQAWRSHEGSNLPRACPTSALTVTSININKTRSTGLTGFTKVLRMGGFSASMTATATGSRPVTLWAVFVHLPGGGAAPSAGAGNFPVVCSSCCTAAGTCMLSKTCCCKLWQTPGPQALSVGWMFYPLRCAPTPAEVLKDEAVSTTVIAV